MEGARREWMTPGVIGRLPPEVRNPLLTTHLWIGGTGGLLVLLLSVASRLTLDTVRHPTFVFLSVLHVGVIGLAVWRSGPFLVRALGLGALCFSWAAILMAYVGPAGLVALFLVVCTLLGGSLYGVRGFAVTFTGVVVLYGVSAYGWSRGYLPLVGSFSPDYRSVSYWALNLASFLLGATLIAALVHFLLHRTSLLLVEEMRMGESLAREQRLRAEAELTRLREEVARHHAEATLATMLRAAPIGIALVRDGRLVTINERMGEMFGYEPGVLANRTLASLFEGSEAGAMLAREVPRRFGEGQLMALECATQTRTGVELWVSITAIPLDAANPDAGMVATFADITGLRHSAEMLREREERLREIFDHTSEVIYSVHVQPTGEFVLERVNCAAAAYGVDVAAVNAHGRTVRDMYPAATAEQIERDFRACASGKGPLRVRREIHLPAGTFHFATTLVPVQAPDGSRVVRLVGLSRDVTAEVRSQELEQARAGAEAANRAKSAFLAHMSHEIRTPLNAILGFARLLRRESDASPRQVEALEIIHRNGEHLLGLINDILEISTIEAGRASLRESTVALADFAADIRATFAATAAARGLDFLLEIAPACPSTIRTDVGKLRQILSNLLDNALKFTATGGVALRVNPGRDLAHAALVFEVSDTGPGIAPEDVARLFRPFEQADAGRTIGGTGLGLAISRGFARVLGGELILTSTPGQGSTFTLVLPAGTGTEAPSAPAIPLAATSGRATGRRLRGAGLRVLVVDDVADNRVVLARFLERAGVEVQVAARTPEALEIGARWRPRCAVVDMRLPGEDAARLVRELRQVLAPEPLAILGLSASVFAEDRGGFAASGIDAFLPKPFQDDDVLDAIERLSDVRFERLAGAVPESRPRGGIGADLRQAILQAADESDYVALQTLIDQSAMADSELGAQLREHLRGFDYDGLRARLGEKGGS